MWALEDTALSAVFPVTVGALSSVHGDGSGATPLRTHGSCARISTT